MAKIGTAHIEVKPVLNEEALDAIVQCIEDAVAEGVRRGMDRDVHLKVQVDNQIAAQIVRVGEDYLSATN
jgi:hypothetical protein